FPELPHDRFPSFGFAGFSPAEFYGKRSSGTGRGAAEPARTRHSGWNEACSFCKLRDLIDFSVRIAPRAECLAGGKTCRGRYRMDRSRAVDCRRAALVRVRSINIIDSLLRPSGTKLNWLEYRTVDP